MIRVPRIVAALREFFELLGDLARHRSPRTSPGAWEPADPVAAGGAGADGLRG